MASYTYQDLMQMQSDAIKRVEEMQKKARVTAGLDAEENKSSPLKGRENEKPKHIPMPEGYLKSDKQKTTENKKQAFNITLGNGDVEIDSDKALILSLILLLAEEQADELLLTALVYMLG